MLCCVRRSRVVVDVAFVSRGASCLYFVMLLSVCENDVVDVIVVCVVDLLYVFFLC